MDTLTNLSCLDVRKMSSSLPGADRVISRSLRPMYIVAPRNVDVHTLRTRQYLFRLTTDLRQCDGRLRCLFFLDVLYDTINSHVRASAEESALLRQSCERLVVHHVIDEHRPVVI